MVDFVVLKTIVFLVLLASVVIYIFEDNASTHNSTFLGNDV